MKQLEEVLKNIGWESYEAKAYCSLVEHGSSKLNDLSFRSRVPEGKIYTTMSHLEKRGAVIKTGKRPQKFDAQNPRHVLELEQNQLIENCNRALAKAEQAWEIRHEKIEEKEKAWQTAGISGIFNEIRRLLEVNYKSIQISISDLDWLTSKDINNIKNSIADGGEINIVTFNGLNSNILHRLIDGGVNVRITDEQPMNFCIFDHETVLWIFGNFEVASIMVDKNMANIIEIEFKAIFKKCTKPGDDMIAA